MKRLLNLGVRGGIVLGLVGVLASAALALTISGRDTSQQRSISQVGIRALSTDLGVTATASGTQVNSYQITAGFTLVTTVATIGDSVKMPSITALGAPTNVDAALNIIIVNNTANSMNVFPFAATDVIVSGGAAASAGAAMAVAALKSASCWSATSTGRWYCIIG